MLLETALIILGFIGLIWGADRFVFGASSVAYNLGISHLMIGLTIVAFGTSAPEIFSSAVAAIEDKPELAIGNAFGSNLFNVGIALGVTAIISPLNPPRSLVSEELPALLLVTLATAMLVIDFYIGTLDAIILITIAAFLGYKLFKRESTGNELPTESRLKINEAKYTQGIAYLILGLILLVVSAEVLVYSASAIAARLNVSTAIIGLTIVALGTSLPELAASIASVLKGHHDLAIGNIIGSNILNLLAVLPFPALIAAGAIDPSLVYRDFLIMLMLTLLLCSICYRCVKTQQKIGRLHGVVFLSIYCSWFTFMLFDVLD